MSDPNSRVAIEKYRKEEKLRRISRNYKAAKGDIQRVKRGEDPKKPFVNEKDKDFFSKVVDETEKCIAAGGKTE